MKLQYHTFATGLTQSGKTTSVMKLLMSQSCKKIFFNTKRERKWHDYFNVIVDMKHLSDREIIELIDTFYRHPNISICFDPDIKRGKEALTPIIDHLLEKHMNESHRVIFVIDEIHVFQSGQGLHKSIEKLWVMGLGLGIVGVAIAQRPQQIHQTIRNNSETQILHFTKTHDLEYMKDEGYIDFVPEFTNKYTAFILPASLDKWKRFQ